MCPAYGSFGALLSENVLAALGAGDCGDDALMASLETSPSQLDSGNEHSMPRHSHAVHDIDNRSDLPISMRKTPRGKAHNAASSRTYLLGRRTT